MKVYVGSDHHFGHKNILKFNAATRQFRDVDHMNEMLVEMWNDIVTPDDLVYILGDFAFTSSSVAARFAARMNGRKILIQGNHDSKLVKDVSFRREFEEIHMYHEINHNGAKIIMCHYPFAEWNGCHRGSLMLHGHLHGSPTGLDQYRIMDVGMDATGKIVSDLDDIVEQLLKRDLKTHGYVKSVIDSKGHFVEVK